ncbi:MAG: DUF305 domain-containing protein [Solirubrobacterales bacterium]|nr:DUF305 domain-containing protein [Solirubrobacterales bacterium]
MSSNKFPIIGIVTVFAIVGAFLLIRGSDDSDRTDSVDAAFAADMIPHHEGAISMARIAEEKAEHPQTVVLARGIVAGQSAEIEKLGSIYERLTGDRVDSAPADGMGMSDSDMGMDMDMSALEKARPFDREFIDQMIPHHQGAIRMAYMVLEDGEDEETVDLAEAVVAAQSKEIDQMNRWRLEWYGAESPAGGVPARPAAGEAMDSGHSMEGMNH